jgi:hypothetical protein
MNEITQVFFDELDQMIDELSPDELRELAIAAGIPAEEFEQQTQ